MFHFYGISSKNRIWCYFLVSEVTVLGFLFWRSLFGGKEQEVTPESIKNTAVEKYDHLTVQSAFNQNFTCVFMLLFFPVPCSQVGTRSFVCSLMFPPSICQRRSCAFKIKWLIELFSVALLFIWYSILHANELPAQPLCGCLPCWGAHKDSADLIQHSVV